MISFLKGDIVEINVDYVLVDVNGVGFQVFVGKPQDFSYGRSLIYTYYHVKEDGVSLYGFKTKQEQDLFLRLINVSGIGPKTASGILGATTTNSLISAIELGNIAFLKKLPSIGPKAAQQIILDLKGKLISDEQANKPSAKKSDKYSDVYDALRQFGYKVAEIDNAINKVENIENLQTVTIIKECLKLLRK
ncbi:MAG: Holliday junction branch migration protein RuvA [Bacilli bacterium]|nr:Holliday junction branch migration protein RuvA [Bacilli bacterium]